MYITACLYYPLLPNSTILVSLDENGKQASIMNNVYFHSGDTIDLTWDPNSFISFDDTKIGVDDILIDIKLYEIEISAENIVTTTELAVLASGIENTGSMVVTVPSGASQSSLARRNILSNVVKTVTVFVEAVVKPAIKVVAKGIGYFTNIVLATINYLGDDFFWQKCQEWAKSQPANTGQMLLDRVLSTTPCPPFETQARTVISGLKEDSFRDSLLASFFHPEADRCYRQRTITR